MTDTTPTPAVIHYCGHLMHGLGVTAGIRANHLDALTRSVALTLTSIPISHAFGALACGADILIAEQVVAKGAELHVVLPFPAPRFLQTSVAPAGGDWPTRFDRLLKQAASCTTLSDPPGPDLDPHYRTAALHAMEAARELARARGASVLQLAIWDGQPATEMFGTAAAVTYWRAMGLTTRVIPLPARSSADSASSA